MKVTFIKGLAAAVMFAIPGMALSQDWKTDPELKAQINQRYVMCAAHGWALARTLKKGTEEQKKWSDISTDFRFASWITSADGGTDMPNGQIYDLSQKFQQGLAEEDAYIVKVVERLKRTCPYEQEEAAAIVAQMKAERLEKERQEKGQ